MAKIADINEKIAENVVEGYKKIEDKFTKTFLNEEGELKTGKIGEGVVEGYKKIEDGVVEGYKKIENGVVSGFEKISDKFVDVFFTKEGETVQQAKDRLNGVSAEQTKEECADENLCEKTEDK